ncbi:PREDICTED: putative F-box/LRR-repeat protein At3g44080 [Camelina sativa]|uniref:F-box/LRR-repeat protein At3g44080 n=1 Tax=Camelina sativa TaxID=90675 RepID=A0ABM0WBI3_CAMSA|nr:PREDICTED: putative F-box/LRR-repeat protein At3g44080 [Camelina sativa]
MEFVSTTSIDSLPDDLLVQMLSFLPTKQAASTSLLSKRWKTLFSLCHNLDCDDSIFFHPEKSKRKGFRHFVYRTLDSQGALKILFLDFVSFTGDQFSGVFLAACPALEDLTILQDNYSQGEVISSKTIKRLSVTYKRDVKFHPLSINSLDIPSLVDLYYSDYARLKPLHCNLDSLSKATLDLTVARDYNTYKLVYGDVTPLISGIRNVKTLHLTTSAVRVITVCCKRGLPVFNNLLELVFLGEKKGLRVLLPLLLERSPNLKFLVLSGLHRYTFKGNRFLGIHIPPNNQIKMVSIKEHQGNANELQHINHFLLKMKRLDVVKVYVAPTLDDPKQMQLTQDLLKLSYKIKIFKRDTVSGTTVEVSKPKPRLKEFLIRF